MLTNRAIEKITFPQSYCLSEAEAEKVESWEASNKASRQKYNEQLQIVGSSFK